mmetsp:Transcript_8765/g.16645  ORF Transcript_8765/g.16645 Transcript_8765/m.16645 type:complete len:191 (+) Transcript_8765:68-640(+)
MFAMCNCTTLRSDATASVDSRSRTEIFDPYRAASQQPKTAPGSRPSRPWEDDDPAPSPGKAPPRKEGNGALRPLASAGVGEKAVKDPGFPDYVDKCRENRASLASPAQSAASTEAIANGDDLSVASSIHSSSRSGDGRSAITAAIDRRGHLLEQQYWRSRQFQAERRIVFTSIVRQLAAQWLRRNLCCTR